MSVIETMPGISLWQPWAAGIMHGTKPFETRHWQLPKKLLGEEVFIHAAKTKPTWYDEWNPWGCAELFGVDQLSDLPRGVIVGTCRFVQCYRTEELVNFHDDELTHLAVREGLTHQAWVLGNFGPQRFAWKIADVKPIVPIPLTGRQGFFNVPLELIRGAA